MKKMAIISDWIRRDLQDPLRFFSRIKIVHFYSQMGYNDFELKEDSQVIKYNNPYDLYKKIIKANPDIIQCPEPYANKNSFVNSLVAVIAAKKLKVPYFFPVFENRPVQLKFNKILGFFLRRYLGWLGRKASFVINLNDGAKKNLLLAGVPKNKIVRLMWGTWGIDENEFKPSAKKDFENPILLFVGKVENLKGIWDLLDAYKALLSKYPTLGLEIIGAGREADNIKKWAKENNFDQIKVLGTIANEKLPEYFSKAFLTIVPSVTIKEWEEQVGMVNIQSLACGTPVISTKSGAIPEFIPDGKVGYLVYEHSPNQIAEKTELLLNDRALYNKLSVDSRKYTIENYTAKENIKKAEKVLENALKN